MLLRERKETKVGPVFLASEQEREKNFLKALFCKQSRVPLLSRTHYEKASSHFLEISSDQKNKSSTHFSFFSNQLIGQLNICARGQKIAFSSPFLLSSHGRRSEPWSSLSCARQTSPVNFHKKVLGINKKTGPKYVGSEPLFQSCINEIGMRDTKPLSPEKKAAVRTSETMNQKNWFGSLEAAAVLEEERGGLTVLTPSCTGSFQKDQLAAEAMARPVLEIFGLKSDCAGHFFFGNAPVEGSEIRGESFPDNCAWLNSCFLLIWSLQ